VVAIKRIVFLGAMQAVIGWWMVYSGLQKQPAVSHYRLATHLMSAFTLFAFTFWFALKLIFSGDLQEKGEAHKLKVSALILVLIVIVQIIYGAFTADLLSRMRQNSDPVTFLIPGQKWENTGYQNRFT
jgi:heme a synthase